MPCPQVYVLVDGEQWFGWQSLSVLQSIDQVAHTLEIETSSRESAGVNDWNVGGGSIIDVRVAPDFETPAQQLFKGYVRRYEQSVDSGSHRISIGADSEAIDIAEASNLGPYFWREGTRQEDIIRQLLEPFGLSVRISKALKVVPKEGFRVGVNETPLSIINKIAEKNGLATFTDSTGQFVLSDGSDAINLGTGYQTGDYIALSQVHDLESQYSEVIVKAQRNTRKQKSQASFASDQQVLRREVGLSNNRHRPKLLISNGDEQSQAELDKYIRDRLNGKSKFIQMTVKSPFTKEVRPETGLPYLWGINQQTRVSEPRFQLFGDPLRTVQVEHTMDNGGGYTVQLDMTVPDIFSGTPIRRAVQNSRGSFFDEIFKLLKRAA